ncbi:cobalamin-dependent protein [Rhodospirillum sp. A1_3_36]|uniref:cobalamin-dependent protein n=1 Tax=Rhodospirillum sp. A1_3_36 TaxID=3391666 RepID=UPI0039A50B29
MAMTELNVAIIQLSGESSIRYTPLAAMNMHAAIAADPRLSGWVSVRVHDFLQSHTQVEMLEAILAEGPDLVSFSCQGWNMRQLQSLFPAVRQFLPDSLLMIGGVHVSGRGRHQLAVMPDVDVVANGEGEAIMPDLLAALRQGLPLDTVPGLTLRRDGGVLDTAPRQLSRSLDEFPSPYAAPGLPLDGYDIALLETNRGCPYSCGYCFWGGRIGGKLAKRDMVRIKSDIEAIALAKIPGLFLCDANFGLLKEDEEVAAMVIDAFRRHGYPREFNVNWAKNNAARVGQIVRDILAAGIHTVINVPLQSNSRAALDLAGRGVIGRESMLAECRAMMDEGHHLTAELIFGLPGESLAAFMDNYDDLYATFPAMRIHPLWILPNTDFDRNRVELGIRTISPDPLSDYEAVIAHAQMTPAETRNGLALLLGHSILNLLGAGRSALRALVRWNGASPAATVAALEGYLATSPHPLAEELTGLYTRLRRSCYFERSLRDCKREILYRNRDDTAALIKGFFASLQAPATVLDAVQTLVEFDCMLLPRSDLGGEGFADEHRMFPFRVIDIADCLARQTDAPLPDEQPVEVSVRHKRGLATLRGSNCDLTGAWNGKVVDWRPMAEGRICAS